MTVIDENGRIFGKVNLIDLLVVSALVGLIPCVNMVPVEAIEEDS